MKHYVIVTESGADLSPEMIAAHDIRVADMHVEIDGTDHLDRELPLDQLTGYYDQTGQVPKTAGVNPHQYQEIFAAIKAEDPDAVIIHICYSAQLSVGFQSSLIADDEDLEIHRIDAKNVSIGHGIIVMKAAQIIEQEPDIEPAELVKRIEEVIEKTRFVFVPGNLDYLRAGGRVSNAQYLGAKLLRVKPLIEVLDGLMLSTKKYKGSRSKIVHSMLNEYFENNTLDGGPVFLAYSGSLDDDIKAEMEALVTAAGATDITWLQTGAVITAHAGPGGVGIAGIEA